MIIIYNYIITIICVVDLVSWICSRKIKVNKIYQDRFKIVFFS